MMSISAIPTNAKNPNRIATLRTNREGEDVVKIITYRKVVLLVKFMHKQQEGGGGGGGGGFDLWGL
jgi:hypothetical protein